MNAPLLLFSYDALFVLAFSIRHNKPHGCPLIQLAVDLQPFPIALSQTPVGIGEANSALALHCRT